MREAEDPLHPTAHKTRGGDHAIMVSLLFDVVDAATRSLMHGDAQRFDRRQAFDEATEAICRYIAAGP